MKYLTRLVFLIYYCIAGPISILLSILTWFLSPLLALPCFVVIEDGREWLIKPLRWFQTFDHPVDHWYRDTYWTKCNLLKWDWTKPTHRYLGRLFWICRNPAYGFAQFIFGVEPIGTKKVYSAGKWDSDSTNYELTLFDNTFYFIAQLYFYKKHYVRVNMGWKEHTPFRRWMLATNINPFKVWEDKV